MTLIKPGGVREYAAANYARQMRLLSTGLLMGNSGLRKLTDFSVVGSSTSMDLQIAAGLAFVQMPGVLQGANPFPSDAAEVRTLATAPGSGTRHDVYGIQVWDQEYGDGVDDWDLRLLTNPAINNTTLPTPTSLGSPSAAWLPIMQVDVPAGATTASRCTFKLLAKTVAQLRDGGYGGTDLALPRQDVVSHQTNVVGADGWVYSFVVPAPQTYSTIQLVFTGPTGGTPDVPTGYVLDRVRCTPVDFWFRVAGPNGVLTQGTGISYDAIYKT